MKDKDGIKIKHPNRNCKMCGHYPCFEGQTDEILKCDMAKYGCTLFKDKK